MNADTVMRIERHGEPAGVVESTMPLEVPGPDGSKVPTDLKLARTAEGPT